MNSIGKLAAGGCTAPVVIMKATEAATPKLLATHPGPKAANARTPINPHAICAMNMFFLFAAGDEGVVNSTAQTAPNGAIVKVTPLCAIIWSNLPRAAIAANAPADGHKMSLREIEGDETPPVFSRRGNFHQSCPAQTITPLLLP